jgi:hypothetical protein
MAININSTNVTVLQTDTDDMKLAQINGGYIWAKPYTLTISSENIITVTCYRTTALEPTAGTGSSSGALANNSVIYHGDYIYAIGTSTDSTRIVGKTASPVAFNGDNIEYITDNETITFSTQACICGTIANDSICTSCASSLCTLDISGSVCTTCARNICTTSTTSSLCGTDCALDKNVPTTCTGCGNVLISALCKSCGLLEIATSCVTCGSTSASSLCTRCRFSAG